MMMPSISLFGAAVLLLLAGDASCTPAGRSPTRNQQYLSKQAATDDSWHKYVRAPSSKNVKPKMIVQGSVLGGVTNPNGLINGNGPTVLTRSREGDSIPSLIVDFGQNLAGLLKLDLQSSGNSSKGLPGIRLAFSETLEYLGDSSDFTRSYNADGGDRSNRIVPQGTDQIAVGTNRYTWTDTFGCQHGDKVCADGLHGFRYVKIWLEALPSDAPYTTSFGKVTISSISLTYSGFLGTPDTFTGWFECSDEELTQWWYDGVYTNDLCTDVFRANDTDPRQAASQSIVGKLVLHDGAKRDRDPYAGDVTIAGLTSYLSHDVPEASRNVLADLAEHQRSDGWIPPASIRSYTLPLFDYPLHWIVSSYNLVLFTGDLEYIREYYPVLVKTLDSFYTSVTDQSTSLLSKGLAGTGGYGDYAFLPRNGSVTYYNALYVMALNHAAELAGYLSKNSDADRWRARASKVSASLAKRNWDDDVGAFFDGSPCPGHSSDPICPTHSQDGNSIAILAGVAASDRNSKAESILNYLTEANSRPYGNSFFDNDNLLRPDQQSDPYSRFSSRVYAFISFFELSARFSLYNHPNTIDSAFDQLRRTYRWMARHDPTGTFWEGIGPDGHPYERAYTSMAHGWSTGVTPILTSYVLGVTPLSPGFRRFGLRPVPPGHGVTWARGVVPTPDGNIEVEWRNLETRGFQVSVKAPSGSTGEIAVPVTDSKARVSLDGEVIHDSSGGRSGVYRNGYVEFEVSGGDHSITVE